MIRRLSAIIPCAGLSARMGCFKPLLPLGGKPVVKRVIETVRHADPEVIYVVLGHRAEELEPVVIEAGAKVIHNPNFAKGMFSTVRAGVKGLADSCDAFIFLPADIPLVRPATIRRLAAISHRHPSRLLYPVFLDQRGHPPVIPGDLIPSILSHNGDGGLRRVLEYHEDRALEVPVADENILFDLDHPQDYDAASQRLSRLNDPSPIECEAILAEVFPTEEDVVRHGRQVQRTALALCRAMNLAGAGMDEGRVAAAGLMHDIAKGNPDHARVGGDILKEMGFDHVAELVAAHTDLPEAELHHPGEAAIVYLADKLTLADRCVPLETRFERALRRYGADPAVRLAIEKRRSIAMTLKSKIEHFTGRPLSQLYQE
jgi:CTP:molybdopterin cytidylyltransferase MocA/HD superfamily phosphohydrolase YqeK